ncbi:hypothetical protein ZIOFF_069598 [Zingiber officinale]|uniref:Uncharacterized protein n=1 Tax=Zingiber officinale TaxID=94328 RepID=A0A8J5BHB0_ZINOF|nr:hypothetical protein ZIOFF_069598 [Zingiber officinale]
MGSHARVSPTQPRTPQPLDPSQVSPLPLIIKEKQIVSTSLTLVFLNHFSPTIQGKAASPYVMADKKMAVVAFLLVVVLMAAASTPAVSAFGCFSDCYDRCANGKIGNVPCATMCGQACIVSKEHR